MIKNIKRTPRRDFFDPLDLFEKGKYKGYWIDANDVTTLKQDTSGSIPVVNDGDPVGYVTEKSTNSIFVRSQNDDRRPLYKIVNGRGCLRFDGVNEYLEQDTVGRDFVVGSEFTTVSVTQRLGDNLGAGEQTIFSFSDSGGSSISLRWINTNQWKSRRNPGAIDLFYTGTPDNLTVATVTHKLDGIQNPNRVLRLNGVEVATLTPEATASYVGGTGQWSTVGSSNGSLFAFANVFQIFVINKYLIGEELLNLERNIAARAGL